MVKIVLLSAAVAGTAFAGEYAVLDTGFRLHAESHETIGGRVRLHTPTGIIELSVDSVVAFEAEEYQPPSPPSVPALANASEQIENRPTVDPKDLLRAAAEHTGLPPALVTSVASVESGFRPDAVSPKGAVGVMQLMPETARALDVDPHDTTQNIEAGARLLRELLIKYDGNVVKALSAYNAGSRAVDRYNGIPPYPETQEYVYKVVKTYLKNGGK